MEYEELLNKIIKEKKVGRNDRFTPPPANITVSGQKTVISADALAKYINRPLAHIAKYLMHELTAPGQVDSMGRIIMGGKFSRHIVQDKLDAYIKEYVICKQCKSPDTQMKKVDNNHIVTCLACGAEYPVGRIK